MFSCSGDTPRKQALMQALDTLNLRYGRGTVQSAGEGIRQRWKMQRKLLTPRYTTNWDELLTVRAS